MCKSILCPKDTETNFYSRECILGQCKNNCKITCISDDLKNDMAKIKSKKVHYYVFETVETKYHKKHGKLVTYTRTARVDKNDLLENIARQLQILAEKYFLHRFFVVNEKCCWKKFLDQTEHYTLWLDYSQNIAFKEKKQAQSVHFSGRQHTLHKTIILSPENEVLYVYHLSDDTNHDSVMNFHIIRDILKYHSEVIQNGILVLRSDNCQEQYKCKYIFYEMKILTKELRIKVVWFYGEPGHGRGLVDAMCSFGWKQQLRNEIITNDSWFQNAEEMVRFLQQYFLDDESKEHHLVDEAENAKVKANERGELEIKPCRKFHVIGVNEDSVFTKKLYFTNPNII